MGFFVEPTIVETKDPHDKIMKEEIFGPVLTVFVYPDNKVDEALKLADSTTPYALTGAIFASDGFVFETFCIRDHSLKICQRFFFTKLEDKRALWECL